MKIIFTACTWAACSCVSTALLQEIQRTSHRAAQSEAVRSQIEVLYRQEGNRQIAQAQTRDQAEQAISDVRQRWVPVWGICNDDLAGPTHRCHDGAWPVLVAAHEAWVSILQRQGAGESVAITQVQQVSETLRQAYCVLGASFPTGVAVPPLVQTECEMKP